MIPAWLTLAMGCVSDPRVENDEQTLTEYCANLDGNPEMSELEFTIYSDARDLVKTNQPELPVDSEEYKEAFRALVSQQFPSGAVLPFSEDVVNKVSRGLVKERQIKKLNEVSLVDYATEEKVVLGSYIDFENPDKKLTVLSFWASWCGPCVQELPFIYSAQQSRPDVNFVTINLGDTPGVIKALLKKNNIDGDFKVLIDHNDQKTGAISDYKAFRQLSEGERGVPLTLVYDEMGQLIDKQSGFGEPHGDENPIIEMIEGVSEAQSGE